MTLKIQRRVFTVGDYHKMLQAGILSEDDRVELLDGEIVQMAPIGSRHSACVGRLTQLFSRRLAERAIVWVQNPIRLGEYSEPQPDLALLTPREDFYASAHPGPENVLLVVEVAETSAATDREVKVPLYARGGIQEVWLIDLASQTVEVFRKPSPDGYLESRQVQAGDRLAPLAFPDFGLLVDELLP